ncbi:MAG: hypothetical protein ACLF0P_07210 [Thermoanaerobaculia bacterium]
MSRSPSWVHRTKAAAWVLAASAALVVSAGCGGEGEPVARLKVDPATIELPHGSFVDLRFAWEQLAPLGGASDSRRVFVHLLDAEGRLVRTFDHDPEGPWRAGESWTYTTRIYQSFLAPPLPPGTYALTAGLYDAEGNRWPLAVEGETVDEGEYQVARVEVPESGPDQPTLAFSQAWSPTLAGSDRQVLGYRWLNGTGEIALQEVPGSGTLWLGLRVPPEGGELQRRMNDPEAPAGAAPRVEIDTSCSGFQAQVSGEGAHRVDVPVTPEGEGCTVTLDPNYVMATLAGDRHSLSIEVVAWRGE